MVEKCIKSHKLGGYVVEIMEAEKSNRSRPEKRYYAVIRRTRAKTATPRSGDALSLDDLQDVERLARMAQDTILTRLRWTIQPDT